MRRKTKQQKGIEKSVSPSLMAAALREMFNRLTDEEKREFIKTFDWNEIEEIRSEDRLGREDRICGDPKIYVLSERKPSIPSGHCEKRGTSDEAIPLFSGDCFGRTSLAMTGKV